MFSILVPTWNNLEYLQLCVAGIRKHTSVPYEILVHVNEGTDGTPEWLQSQGIRYTSSERNLGVCMSLNELAMHATQPWIAYLNDDMYCCPGWDTAFARAIAEAPTDLALYASRLIEPFPSKFPFIDCFDAGRTPSDFDEDALLKAVASLPSSDVDGEGSQPTVVSRLWWHRLGGYGIEYSPGMSSDDDFLLKMWAVGCRRFKVVGDSHVYHFSQRSTGRIRRNKGGHTLLLKWGLTSKHFRAERKRLLAVGAGAGAGTGILEPSLANRLRRAWLAVSSRYPLLDTDRFAQSLSSKREVDD
jgi:GT2 family glycosyltransferase